VADHNSFAGDGDGDNPFAAGAEHNPLADGGDEYEASQLQRRKSVWDSTDPCRVSTDPCRVSTDPCRVSTDPCRVSTDPCRVSTVRMASAAAQIGGVDREQGRSADQHHRHHTH
jgi:hypothetical protein